MGETPNRDRLFRRKNIINTDIPHLIIFLYYISQIILFSKLNFFLKFLSSNIFRKEYTNCVMVQFSNNNINIFRIIIEIHKWPVGNGEGGLMFLSLTHLCPAPSMTTDLILYSSYLCHLLFFTKQCSFSFASFDLSPNGY